MIFIQLFAYALKINLKTLRYNFLTFSLRGFMQDSSIQSYPHDPLYPRRKDQSHFSLNTKTTHK
ncbi:hypothetical protein [Helicobacter pylori]|uniref:hypothetical protein n=1 Tax=Helicobacter pylori TaxID=210 RepID=UPI000EB364AB|nr:hypothetical protein [Helicobacter pylori]